MICWRIWDNIGKVSVTSRLQPRNLGSRIPVQELHHFVFQAVSSLHGCIPTAKKHSPKMGWSPGYFPSEVMFCSVKLQKICEENFYCVPCCENGFQCCTDWSDFEVMPCDGYQVGKNFWVFPRGTDVTSCKEQNLPGSPSKLKLSWPPSPDIRYEIVTCTQPGGNSQSIS